MLRASKEGGNPLDFVVLSHPGVQAILRQWQTMATKLGSGLQLLREDVSFYGHRNCGHESMQEICIASPPPRKCYCFLVLKADTRVEISRMSGKTKDPVLQPEDQDTGSWKVSGKSQRGRCQERDTIMLYAGNWYHS